MFQALQNKYSQRLLTPLLAC